MKLPYLMFLLLFATVFDVDCCEDKDRHNCYGVTKAVVDRHNCNKFYPCSQEDQNPCPVNCMDGLGFDEALGFCNWEKLVPACSRRQKQYPCPGGYYCPEENVQIHCPIGSCCQPNSTSPTPCPPGFFCLFTCGEERPKCDPGNFCPNSPTEPIICPPGLYCPVGSSEPLSCPCGTYNPNSGIGSKDECINCPFGQFFCPPGSSAPYDYSCTSPGLCADVPSCNDQDDYGTTERGRCQVEQRYDCKGAIGRIGDKKDCSVFYVCTSHLQYPCPSSCPNGLVFNQKLEVCDWPSNVSDC